MLVVVSIIEKIVVIDTNVLLSDPYALYAYPDAEVVIPQTVLSELDKLKLARGDGEIRFRGREVSRTLFELSQHGSLLAGIELDNGASVRVVQYEPQDMPPTLNQKNGDDRILATAWRLGQEREHAEVILLTNDLNMLLKGQALGIEVQQHDYEYRRGFWKRLFSPVRKRRLPVTWIMVPVILVGLFVSLWIFDVPSPIPVNAPTLATTSFPLKEAQYLDSIKRDSTRFEVWIQLGDHYLDWADKLQVESKFDDARDKRVSAADAFKHALRLQPGHTAAKTSLGTSYFLLGDVDEAINQLVQAIDQDPNFALAYFNLGFVLFSQKDYDQAERHFRAYLKLEPHGERSDFARERLREITSFNNTST